MSVFVARIVDQHDHGLALHIDAGIVVPVIFRRHHAIAHEHNVGVFHIDIGRGKARRPIDHVVGEFRGQRALGRGDGKAGGVLVQGDGHRRHGLEIAAVIARLDADALEFIGDPPGGRFAILRTGAAAFESVIGQRLVAGGDIGGGDFRRGRRMAGVRGAQCRQNESGREQRGGGEAGHAGENLLERRL